MRPRPRIHVLRARSLLVVAAVLTASIGVQIGRGPAATATTATELPIRGSIFDVVVDGANDHVFISSGPGDDAIAVLDYAGNIVTTLSVPGASGMALHAGTLYVAAADADEIATVDTTASPPTLGTAIDIGPFTHPGSLAYVAGTLWFTTGTCGSSVDHAHVDTDSTNLSSAADTLNAATCPRYATSPADANLLVMWDEGVSPMTLSEYDMSTAPPTLVRSAANPDGSGDGDDVVFGPGGASFITAAESTAAFGQVKTSDLSLIREYPAASRPDAVDTTASAGGRLLGGSDTPGGDSLWVYDLGTATPTNSFDLPGGDAVVPRGVAWSDDGSAVFAVERRPSSRALRFYALDPASTDSTLTLSAKPATVTVGDDVMLSGALTAADASSVAGEKVSVSRTDATGTQRIGRATVAADGSYSLVDAAHVGGQTTYRARFNGSFHVKPSEATDTVAVTKLASRVSVRVSDAVVRFGRSVKVTGHLGPGTRSRVLELYAQPDGGGKRLLRRAEVDRRGDLSVSFSPNRDTTFFARFDGDLTHRGSEDHTVTRVHVVVSAKLVRFSSTSGRYKIYRRGTRAPVRVHVAPAHGGSTVVGTLQAYARGHWDTLARKSAALNAKSDATFYARGSAGVNFRVRIRMETHADHLGDASPWLYLRFK